MRRFLALMTVVGVVAATAAAGAESVGKSGHPDASDDPYVWLEDIHGAKPIEWVKAQNAKSMSVLQADPDYQKDYDAILKVMDATDRIPYGDLDHQFVFNFWQDAMHPKGIWRRTTTADYARATPAWDTLLDVDKLAADEHENWVWKGAECSVSLKRCLVNLSRGGGDAVVVREFDPAAKSFLKDGFTLTEAKSSITYLDEDTVLFGTDFGAGSMTTSGYPRLVKLWKRGTPMTEARTVHEGKDSDVASAGVVFRNPAGTVALVQRAVSFFTTEYYALAPDGTTHLMPVPLGADLKGAQGGDLIFTLREDWTPPGGAPIAKGSLIAYRAAATAGKGAGPAVSVLFTPDAHSSIDEVATGRDAVYASLYHDVTGSVHVFRPRRGHGWSDTSVPLPAGGSTHIVAANAWGPEAYFRFESFTTPTTLYADSGDGRPQAIKSLPPRFDASNLTTEQFFAVSRDGTRIPYFVTRAKNLSGPAPAVLYGYGGFEISMTPSYSANFGMLWLTRGGVFVVANIRGGGEYGPAWHQAALLQNRQKAYDDFQAVAQDIVKRGITTPEAARHHGRLQRRTAGERQHGRAPGAVRCGRMPGAADRHDPLHPDRRRCVLGSGIRRSGQAGRPRLDPQVLALPERQRQDALSTGVLRDRHQRRPGHSRARAQDGGAHGGPGPRGAVLREYRRRSRRCGRPQAGRRDVGAEFRVPEAEVVPSLGKLCAGSRAGVG